MKNIKIIFFFSMLMLFFVACENGVSFDPSVNMNSGTNTGIPDGEGGDGNTGNPDGEGGDTTLTGTHSFTLGFTPTLEFLPPSESVPDNFQFRPLQIKYAGINDTTGKGIKVIFNLTIDVPDVLEVTPPVTEDENTGTGDENTEVLSVSANPSSTGDTTPDDGTTTPDDDTTPDDVPLEEGDQNITVNIDSYIKNEGGEEFVTAYFSNDPDLTTFTFTPTDKTVELTVIYKTVATVQTGILPITFDMTGKFKDVYKKTMPRELNLSVYSKGTVETVRVVAGVLKKQMAEGTDENADPQPEVKILKPDGVDYYTLTIDDLEPSAGEQDYEKIPLTIDLLGVLDEHPVTVTQKQDRNKNLTVTGIKVDATGIVTFTATHSGVKKFQPAEGEVTLTVASTAANVYVGLPFDIVIKTKREHTFEHYIEDYVSNFTVSKSVAAFDNGYFTRVSIDGMDDIEEATVEDKITYEIFRKDDSSANFKPIFTQTVSAKEPFIHNDRNAFILRNPEQEYKIRITHETCTNSEKCTSVFENAPSKTGSRLLTNRELFLAAMDSMRYGVSRTNPGMPNLISNNRKDYENINGNLTHNRKYEASINYTNTYTFTNYIPYFIKLDKGSFMYRTGSKSNAIDSWWDESSHGVPYGGTVEFTSPYGNGSITFDLHISSNDRNNPAWHSGSLKVKVGDRTVTYDNTSGVPFGLYMSEGVFVEKLLDEDGNYTQK